MSIQCLYNVYTMQMQKLAVREQVVKNVVKSGNGGAVWVPKGWLGEEVIVILPQRPKLSLKEKILSLLAPHLKDIIFVAIYGSYARNEQTKESDADVLVVTKDNSIKPGLKDEKLDIISIPIGRLAEAIQKYPVTYYQMIQEAVPLVNSSALDEIKKVKVNKKNFRNYLIETAEQIKSSRELIELDKIDGIYLKSYSAIYSGMLRLRGLFIIHCILKKDSFSNEKFRNWLLAEGLNRKEIEDSYTAYQLIRDGHGTKNLKITADEAEKVMHILEKELRKILAEIHG